MGNCYSSGAGPEIVTSLSNTTARPNQRQQQHANFDTSSDKQTPEMPTLSKEEELRRIVAGKGGPAPPLCSQYCIAESTGLAGERSGPTRKLRKL